jgi:hypothetical protein
MPTVEHDPDINAGAYARAGEAFCVPVNAFMGIDEGDIFLY